MSSIGRVLQQEREQQGRTLKEVSDAVNIKEAYLDALEKENFDVIPGAVVVKGFIRTYAEYLGLDGAELVTAYKKDVVARKPKPEVWQRTRNGQEGKNGRKNGTGRANGRVSPFCRGLFCFCCSLSGYFYKRGNI